MRSNLKAALGTCRCGSTVFNIADAGKIDFRNPPSSEYSSASASVTYTSCASCGWVRFFEEKTELKTKQIDTAEK